MIPMRYFRKDRRVRSIEVNRGLYLDEANGRAGERFRPQLPDEIKQVSSMASIVTLSLPWLSIMPPWVLAWFSVSHALLVSICRVGAFSWM